MDVSVERSSPRGYAFVVPLGGGESHFSITPTFTGHGYYSKKTAAWLRGGFGFQDHASNLNSSVGLPADAAFAA